MNKLEACSHCEYTALAQRLQGAHFKKKIVEAPLITNQISEQRTGAGKVTHGECFSEDTTMLLFMHLRKI